MKWAALGDLRLKAVPVVVIRLGQGLYVLIACCHVRSPSVKLRP
jgi:hypothetical protein